MPRRLLFGYLAFVVTFLSDHSLASASDSSVIDWNDVALQAVRDLHPGPPQVARILAMTHTCIYDVRTAYDPVAMGVVRPEAKEKGGPVHQPVLALTFDQRTR